MLILLNGNLIPAVQEVGEYGITRYNRISER